MSFWLISLKEKGIEGWLLGEFRCCEAVKNRRWRGFGKCRTYDLKCFAG